MYNFITIFFRLANLRQGRLGHDNRQSCFFSAGYFSLKTKALKAFAKGQDVFVKTCYVELAFRWHNSHSHQTFSWVWLNWTGNNTILLTQWLSPPEVDTNNSTSVHKHNDTTNWVEQHWLLWVRYAWQRSKVVSSRAPPTYYPRGFKPLILLTRLCNFLSHWIILYHIVCQRPRHTQSYCKRKRTYPLPTKTNSAHLCRCDAGYYLIIGGVTCELWSSSRTFSTTFLRIFLDKVLWKRSCKRKMFLATLRLLECRKFQITQITKETKWTEKRLWDVGMAQAQKQTKQVQIVNQPYSTPTCTLKYYASSLIAIPTSASMADSEDHCTVP